MEFNQDNKPVVSFIVVVNTNSSFGAIFNLLDSFYPQEGSIPFEFIVIEEENKETERIYRQRFPWVKFLTVEKMLRGSSLRNMALCHARGEIIAFLEDHITVRSDYLKNLMGCFDAGYGIVGGPVENGATKFPDGWVEYFAEYNKWFPQIPAGEINDLPGCNFAYRREVLEKIGFFEEGYFKLESIFHAKARKQGYQFYFCPALLVKHFDEKRLFDFWKYRFAYGRLFAAKREFGLFRRLAYALFFPLIAVYEYVRIFNHARKDRVLLKKLIQCTPWLLPTLSIWALGECVGYLFFVNAKAKNLFLKVSKAASALVMRKVLIECDSIPYQFDHVPLKKILNWIRVEASLLRKPEKPQGWPTHLQIEPTAFCNLRCALCPVTDGMTRPLGHMDFNIFKKLVDETGEYVFLMLLWDWGEPFLNPSIYEMIAYAKRKGIRVISSTNGHIFRNAREADRLIRSGLDTLIVAMDGVTQETYERYRQGGKLEKVLESLKTVIARKRALHSRTPLVNLRFIVMKHNEHEIPALKELAKSLGVDALTLKTLNPCANNTYREKEWTQREDQFLPSDFRYRRFEYGPDGEPLRREDNACKNLWNEATIHWNGTVCPCTYDYDERYPLGDLSQNSFKEIWHGFAYQRMRRQFKTKPQALAFCRECSYAFRGGNCFDETMADAFFYRGEPAP